MERAQAGGAGSAQLAMVSHSFKDFRINHLLFRIQHVKSDKLESGSNAVYVGTMIPGGTVFSLRKVILEKLRLRDLEMMPKKVFNSDDWWWNENEGPRKKRGGNATPNTKEVEKVHIYAAGTDIELTDDEQKVGKGEWHLNLNPSYPFRFTIAIVSPLQFI